MIERMALYGELGYAICEMQELSVCGVPQRQIISMVSMDVHTVCCNMMGG